MSNKEQNNLANKGVLENGIASTTHQFKQFAKEQRWRYKTNDIQGASNEPIAIAKNGKDHLFEGYKGCFGV